MRRLAPRAMASRRPSGGVSSAAFSPNASVAICDATSPALAPPIPSATAKKGGSMSSASSLEDRWRPTSVLPTCSTIRRAIARASLLVAVLAVAYPDHVGDLEPLRRAQLPPVQISPVGGPHVLDIHEVAAGEYSRVGGRCERVVHRNVRRIGPSEHRAACDIEQRAGLIPHCGDHLQPRPGVAASVLGAGLPPTGARGWLFQERAGLIAAEVPPGAAGDPEQE